MAHAEIAISAQGHNNYFFEGLQQVSPSMLIANLPYIAAPHSNIMMPALHGGVDGADLPRVRAIFPDCFSCVSIVSNPMVMPIRIDFVGDSMKECVHMQMPMSLGLEKEMQLICTYGNPVGKSQHARNERYIVSDFLITAMPFGVYSFEPKVNLLPRKQPAD